MELNHNAPHLMLQESPHLKDGLAAYLFPSSWHTQILIKVCHFEVWLLHWPPRAEEF